MVHQLKDQDIKSKFNVNYNNNKSVQTGVPFTLQLCATKICRNVVKDKNTYVILRELHNWEKHPSVINTLEMVLQILIGDEPETGKFLVCMCVIS